MDDDDFEIAPSKKKSSKKSAMKPYDPKVKKAQKKAMLSADLFASAEEFSALIDENEREEDAGGMEQVRANFLAQWFGLSCEDPKDRGSCSCKVFFEDLQKLVSKLLAKVQLQLKKFTLLCMIHC